MKLGLIDLLLVCIFIALNSISHKLYDINLYNYVIKKYELRPWIIDYIYPTTFITIFSIFLTLVLINIKLFYYIRIKK